MAPMRFTKAHEREEARRLRKGFVRSWIGLALCWLPIAGLLFAIGGFVRVMVRITRRYRKRRRVYLAFAVAVLTLCMALLMGELWFYSRNPNVLSDIGRGAWTFITGQEKLPGEEEFVGGTDYSDMDSAGLGTSDGLSEESDGLGAVDGQESDDLSDWENWDDGFDWDSAETDLGLNADDGWADADSADGDDGWADAESADGDDGWLLDGSDLASGGEDFGDPSVFGDDGGATAWEGSFGALHMGAGETLTEPK